MEDAIQIDDRGDFGLWAIEVPSRLSQIRGMNLGVLLAMAPGTTFASLGTLLA